jgi:poly(3-hydroxybutyrate) depolymerase
MKMTYLKPSKVYILLIFTFIANPIFSQKLNSGPQVLSFHSEVDDTDQPYALFIPTNFNEKKKYPLVVMLHGAGSNHRLALRRVFGKSNADGESDVEASRYFPKWKNVDYIVASVNARGTMGYQGIAEKDVLDMLADVKKRFKIDENRTYLTGLSMGGGGTIWIGLTRPDIWAAIAPVCPAPPSESKYYIENAFNLPVHFFQGTEDPAVKVENTRKWVEDFKKSGAKVTYVEYPGVKHDSWVNAYKDEFIFEWFTKFKRNPYPDKLKFITHHLKYGRHYWVEILDMEIGKPAKIETNFKNKNLLDVKTENVEAFALNILSHPNFATNKQLNLNIDGQNIPVFGLTDNQILIKKDQKWMVGKRDMETGKKNIQTAGPMTEVFTDRHIYVYGTQDNPGKEELDQRKKIAEQAADWSFYRGNFMGRVMIFPRILSDKEVRPTDLESAHLVLFGTAKSNAIIAKYANKLPMQLDESKVNTANLTYAYPNGKKYILISSGIPFWEIPVSEESSPLNLRIPAKAAQLSGYKDWVLYSKESNSVLGSSFFTKNWELSENDKNKIKSNVIFR